MKREIKKATPEEMLVKMADLCARSEQCEREILRKLSAKGLSRSESEKVVEDLKERGFINQSRYAKAFANDKMRFAGWGRNKIRGALLAKGISSAEIAEALDNLDSEQYSEICMKAAESKGRTLDLETQTERMKLYRHLLSKGFESELALKCIKSVIRSKREAAEREE